jgi:hypothetical protein
MVLIYGVLAGEGAVRSFQLEEDVAVLAIAFVSPTFTAYIALTEVAGGHLLWVDV